LFSPSSLGADVTLEYQNMCNNKLENTALFYHPLTLQKGAKSTKMDMIGRWTI